MPKSLKSLANRQPRGWVSRFRRRASSNGFTLAELLVVISIISMLAVALLVVLASVKGDAREARTKSQITRIHELLIERWESYQTRALPVRVPRPIPNMPGMNPPNSPGAFRLAVLRELMRMELPDRKTDVVDPPTYIKPTALWFAYHRRVANQAGSFANWSETHQGAECLYMILSNIQEGDGSVLNFFKPSEIGDFDGDGMPEILDGWGNPIEFLRWPAGYRAYPGPDGQWGIAGTDDDGDGIVDNGTEAGAPGSDDQISPSELNDVGIPDPLDPNQVDGRFSTPALTDDPFVLLPLIFSAGPDEEYEIVTDNGPSTPYDTPAMPFKYSALPVKNDPYFPWPNAGVQMGTQADVNSDGHPGYEDNIDNHHEGTE